ncbi:hypothetical protein ACWN8V_02310 [Vagococcus elongatus]|uniref:hypothetical protein n=1 Tax=Vagococcus elongatus TaxID=180344 RepID=UPI000F86E9AB|nr:hypothetical protein [Vagococcus elongatus]
MGLTNELDDGFYIFLCPKEQSAAIDIQSNGHIIRDNGTLLPYLSIKQQLFSSVSFKRRKEYLKILKKWWAYFRLDKDFLEDTPEKLSPEQLLLINFIHSVAQQKPIIAFEDSKEIILKQFWLDLFPALEKIATEEQLTIILVTSNKQMAEEAQTWLLNK